MHSSLPRFAWALVALVAGVAWFSVLDLRKLQHPDEGRYAEVAREMAQTGDVVTPRLNGLKYFEKPPLQYWLTAAAYHAFEVDQWTARLVPALAGFLAVLITGAATTRLAQNETAGAYAAVVLVSSVMHVAMSHYATLDALLAFCLTGALACFLLAQRDSQAASRVRALMLSAFAFCAFATLAKGLVALVIPAASLVLYTLVTRDTGPWRRLHVVPGTIVYLAITAPWFILVMRENPEFARFFFIYEHFDRFLTSTHRREGAWWYFVPLFLVGILPWLGMLALTAHRMWRDAMPSANGFRWPRFCIVWAGFVFAFFSLSGAKLPSYILPMFPPLAMMLGWQLALLPDRSFRGAVPMAWAMAAALAIGLVGSLFAYEPMVAHYASERQPLALFRAFRPWVIAAFSIWIVGAIAAAVAFRRPTLRARSTGIVATGLTALVGLQVAFVGHDAFRPTRSAWDILRDAENRLGARLDPGAPVFQVKGYDQTLPFYLGRPTTLVNFVDEFALGIAAEPSKAIADEAQWITLWRDLPHGYALLQRDDYERLAAAGLPMRVLARDPRRALVARH